MRSLFGNVRGDRCFGMWGGRSLFGGCGGAIAQALTCQFAVWDVGGRSLFGDVGSALAFWDVGVR